MDELPIVRQQQHPGGVLVQATHRCIARTAPFCGRWAAVQATGIDAGIGGRLLRTFGPGGLLAGGMGFSGRASPTPAPASANLLLQTPIALSTHSTGLGLGFDGITWTGPAVPVLRARGGTETLRIKNVLKLHNALRMVLPGNLRQRPGCHLQPAPSSLRPIRARDTAP